MREKNLYYGNNIGNKIIYDINVTFFLLKMVIFYINKEKKKGKKKLWEN